MNCTRPRIGLIGLGEAGNLGDDLILIATVDAVFSAEPDAEIAYLSYGQRLDWRSLAAVRGYPRLPEPVIARPELPFVRDNAPTYADRDVIIFGGGGLLQTSHDPDQPYGWLKYLPPAGDGAPRVLAVGHGLGPLSRRWTTWLRRLGTPFDSSWVRDPDSAVLSRDRLGWPTRRCHDFVDAAFLRTMIDEDTPAVKTPINDSSAADAPAEHVGDRVLGVALRSWPGFTVGDAAAHVEDVARREGCDSVVFFVLEAKRGEGMDVDFSRTVADVCELPTSVVAYRPERITGFLAAMASVDVAVSMKLHSSAIWGAVGVPMHPIFYAPKVAALFGRPYRGFEVVDGRLPVVAEDAAVPGAATVVREELPRLLAAPSAEGARFPRWGRLALQTSFAARAAARKTVARVIDIRCHSDVGTPHRAKDGPSSGEEKDGNVKKIALVVPEYWTDVARGGGVATVADFVHDAFSSVDGYDIDVISPRMWSRAPESRRLLDPRTWLRGPVVRKRYANGRDVAYVGASLAESEVSRHAPRKALRMALAGHDAVIVVCGTPAVVNMVRGLDIPVVAQVATTVRMERRRLMARGGILRRLRITVITALVHLLDLVGVRAADLVLAENPWMAEWCRSHGARRVELEIPGVDVDFFSPHVSGRGSQHGGAPGSREHGEYLISVGRLGDPRKDFGLLVRAYAHAVRVHGVTQDLVIAGRGDLLPEVHSEIRGSGLKERIHVRCDLGFDELRDAYRDADMFVLASNEEGLGMVLLESLACGTPFVSTATEGAASVVSVSGCGTLVPFGDELAERLGSAVADLANDPERLQRESLEAREAAEKRFSLDVSGERFRGAVDSVIERRERNGHESD